MTISFEDAKTLVQQNPHALADVALAMIASWWTPQQRLTLTTTAVEQDTLALSYLPKSMMYGWTPKQRLAGAAPGSG